jgi:uncharacterized protein
MTFDLRAHTILLAVGGSRAYGIHLPTSDVDVKGVAVPPARTFHGWLHPFEQADDASRFGVFVDTLHDEERAAVTHGKIEGVVYEIRKFVRLATENNPNILDVLFCRDDEVRLSTDLGTRLRAQRDVFLSAQAKHTFSGYATAQLKRIRGHRAWLLSPPRAMPLRKEFGLPEHTLVPRDHMLAVEAAVQKKIDSWELDLSRVPEPERIRVVTALRTTISEMQIALGLASDEDTRWLAAARLVGLDDDLVEAMQRERRYLAAKRHFKQYMEWKENRHPERAALEEKFGYDTKHGAHLVRLLRMGKEILVSAKVNVWRGDLDADELRAIRQGAWSYDELVAWAEGEDQALDALYREGAYVVPDQPDREAIDRLCVEIVEARLGR